MTIREAMLILLVLLPLGGSAIIGFFGSTAKITKHGLLGR
ncbi:multicomponent K+:H+ antiporter subunit A [Bartonella sp. WD16.2]|nr:multicomponent K+:H+ antiporter subunit A [Bartonella sp. WD16.2]